MNTQIFKGNWDEVKGKLKQKWADLTDDDMLKIEGNNDEIYGIIQQYYGHVKDDIRKIIADL